ncbi:MAG: TrbI/VirB10 family protein, partial [Alteromonadaceae bacterium]|nr:TrbI/VirB10 family protein [Alteromonadaceae bacterium]
WVDNHFWERFGGAIMLSFVDDSLSALASRLEESGGDSEVTFDSSTDNAGNMAELALENSIDIKPTGYVEQGTRMSIRVARDVDFSNVYNVERRP